MRRLIKRPEVILTILSVVLRLPGLTLENLWYDESFTAWIAKLPTLDRVIAAVQGDVHPPLWYIVEWFMVRTLGSSEIALRLPSLIAGLVPPLLIIMIARELKFTNRTALLAGFIAAVLPAGLYYSSEARQYAFMSAAVLLLLLGALRGNWLIVPGALLTLYSHNLGVFYVASIGGALLLTKLARKQSILRTVFYLGSGAIPFAPWALLMVGQLSAIQRGFWITPANTGTLLQTFYHMTMGSRASEYIQIGLIIAAFGATGAGLLASLGWLRSSRGMLILAATFGAPLLIAVVSILWRPVYLSRALLASGVLCSLFWASGLVDLTGKNRSVYRLTVIPALMIAIIAYYFPVKARSVASEIVRPIRAEFSAGDAVYFTSVSTAITAGYYLPGLLAYLDPRANDRNQSLDPATKQVFGFDQRPIEDVPAYRIWYLSALNVGSADWEIAYSNAIEQRGKVYDVNIRNPFATTKLILLDKGAFQSAGSTHNP